MTRSRNRGEKFPKNFINIAILLFLRDEKKTNSDIIDFLNKEFGIGEPKGVRSHLDKLENDELLTRNTTIGIRTDWKWSGQLESFKRIINFFDSNKDLIERVVNSSLFFEPLKKEAMTSRIGTTIYVEPKFDSSASWFNTKYVQSFLNKKTLRHFVDKAYSKYLSEEKGSKLNKESFYNGAMGSLSMEMCISFMHYSPSLVFYIINVQDQYKYMIEDAGRVGMGKVFFMVLNDSLILHRGSHAGDAAASYRIERINESHRKGWDLDLACFLPKPIMEKTNANS